MQCNVREGEGLVGFAPEARRKGRGDPDLGVDARCDLCSWSCCRLPKPMMPKCTFGGERCTHVARITGRISGSQSKGEVLGMTSEMLKPPSVHPDRPAITAHIPNMVGLDPAHHSALLHRYCFTL